MKQTNIRHPGLGRSCSMETCGADMGHNTDKKVNKVPLSRICMGLNQRIEVGDLGPGL